MTEELYILSLYVSED